MADEVVLLERRLIEVALRTALEYALEVLPSVLILVDLKVLLEVAARGELFIAILTCKRFFARMDPLMSYEVTHL